jgi:hypothetical protein
MLNEPQGFFPAAAQNLKYTPSFSTITEYQPESFIQYLGPRIDKRHLKHSTKTDLAELITVDIFYHQIH